LNDNLSDSDLNPDLIEHRHDQSIFSLLVKRGLINKFPIRLVTSHDVYSKKQLIPHLKGHPTNHKILRKVWNSFPYKFKKLVNCIFRT
jgi:hypothetical protein